LFFVTSLLFLLKTSVIFRLFFCVLFFFLCSITALFVSCYSFDSSFSSPFVVRGIRTLSLSIVMFPSSLFLRFSYVLPFPFDLFICSAWNVIKGVMFCELPICECGFHPIGFLYPWVSHVGVGYSALFFRRTFVLVRILFFVVICLFVG